jgi:sugar/nucleoside kinase (ribokinase family)
MKGSVDLTRIRVEEAEHYLGRCGWTLARAHARSGDVVAVAGYLGNGDVFDRSMVQFSRTYADQVERDYEAFAEAARSGRIEVAPDPAA